MPVHDWTRVSAGTFHHFHSLWIAEISKALNDGVLPSGYYAMAERIAGEVIPDVLTLQAVGANGSDGVGAGDIPGATAVAVAPPKVRITAEAEANAYALKQRTLAIRHSSDDRIVALVEILSPGNKAGSQACKAFLDKVLAALAHGYHLLLIDLHPPGPRDPEGIHGAIWAEVSGTSYEAPPDKPLTLAAYTAGVRKHAYVEPIAVGDLMPDMPVFLNPRYYVPVPLEATYQAAWRGVPQRWRSVLERSAS